MSHIQARLFQQQMETQVNLQTNQDAHSLSIPAKTNGKGVSANGGELLFLALAACYCNDIYREAAKRNMPITAVEVTVEGDFNGEGKPGENIQYHVKVTSPHPEAEVIELLEHTDQVAEIHNTLRVITPVRMGRCEVVQE